MRSAACIIKISFTALAFCLIGVLSAQAQRVMVLAPDTTDASRDFAWDLEQELIDKVQIQDFDIGKAVLKASPPENVFNMTKAEAQRFGSAIGSAYFLLIKSSTVRRSSSQRPEYYEAAAAIYLVSSRSGRLIMWKLERYEASKEKDAARQLKKAIPQLAKGLIAKMKTAETAELGESDPPAMEEADAAAAENKSFRAPIPYRRLKPEYTETAAFYDVAATVEMLVDLDAKGDIMRTEIVRWAGYGLDESVEKAVRSMNWRPAERNGKPLPMRFLLRYNFKKLPKDTDK